MSFNYNHLANNPMHALMPSLMGNLGNGANFLQAIPGAPLHPTPDEFTAKSPPMNSDRMNGGGGGAANKPGINGGGGGVDEVVGMPQNFMMLSRMMMDPSMLAQYPIFGQLPPQLGPPPPHQVPPPAQQQQQQQQPINPQQQHQGQLPQLQQPTPTDDSGQSMKELISTSSCTLFPPNPSAPPPTTRDRPPGCRTVFVGGLPENVTEEMIRELFDRCGEIMTLRLSKKNFCHIRFAFEASVDSAIYLSGYRMRIGNQADAPNCGRLHVDYAQARDDQYEFECKQRQLQREMRHRERMERDRLRPVSPPLVVHYTEHEASSVSEKLKQDDGFAKAVQTLITWLERGDCSKKNSNTFYSMIQSTYSHVRRLANEKQSCEDELRKAKDLYKKHMQSMVVQFNQIKKVFNSASHKKVYDHLTKAQRKSIEAWKRQVLTVSEGKSRVCPGIDEARNVTKEDESTLYLGAQEMRLDPRDDHEEDEMEMSDDDRDRAMSPMKGNIIGGPSMAKRTKLDNDSLKEENDSLKCQLQVYKNEVDLVRCDLRNDTDLKEQQIKVLQETIRNMQTQLLENKAKETDCGQRIRDLEDKLKSANVKELLLKTKIATSGSARKAGGAGDISSPSTDDQQQVTSIATEEATTAESVLQVKWEHVDEEEARIISLVSAFLVVHPFGASTDYVWSYVNRFVPAVRPKGLEEILVRYSNLFLEDVTGVGAKIERKWRYKGFEGSEEDGE